MATDPPLPTLPVLANGTDPITGLAGAFRQWASLGIVAIDALMLFLAIFWLIPNTQATFHQQLHIDRTTFQVELKAFRDQMELQRSWERERNELWRDQARVRDGEIVKSLEANRKAMEAMALEMKNLKK